MHGQQNIKTRKEFSISYYYIVIDDPGSKLDQNMLGGETGKITFRRIKSKFRTSNNKSTSMLGRKGADYEVDVVKLKCMTVFVARRDSACS